MTQMDNPESHQTDNLELLNISEAAEKNPQIIRDEIDREIIQDLIAQAAIS